MKKLLLIGLVFSYMRAMDDPARGPKRTAFELEMSDQELPATYFEKAQKVEELFNQTKQIASELTGAEKEILKAALQKTNNQTDVQALQKILDQTSQAAYTRGATMRAKLFSSAQKIKNLFLSNPAWIALIADQAIAGEIITRLASVYKLPLPKAALALDTEAASVWIGQQSHDEQIKSAIFYELVEAANQGNIDVFNFLLKHAGDYKAGIVNRAFDGINALRLAVEKNNSELVALLVAIPNIELNELREIDGTTSLMHAAANGYTQILGQLIQAGAALNITSSEENTALLYAVKKNQPNSVQVLVNAGADLNMRDKEGNTALIIASKNNDKKALEILIPIALINIRDNKGFTAFQYTVANGNVEAARKLLNRGAVLGINEYDPDHNNPIITAVARNDLPMVIELITNGARFDVNDKQGNTPLMIAVQKNYPEIVKKLINYGALPNNQDSSLAIAATKNNLALVQMLIKAGANLNAQNRFGNTALMIALERGFDSIVGAMLEAQADVNIQNSEGKTALMIAAKKGSAAFLDRLLRAGARNDLKDTSGNTAYDIAVKSGHAELLQKFQMYGGRQ